MPFSILSEANILAKLRHPGIPIVYDVEEDEAAASYEDEDFSEFAEFGSTDEYEQLAEEDTNEDA